VVVSLAEPVVALNSCIFPAEFPFGFDHLRLASELMEPASPDGSAFPDDVLIVEDDLIIALDFEDTIRGFGVKTVRTAANVAKALEMIADRAPQFALLDVGLVHEKSFAIAERLDALKIPFVFVTGYGADVGLPAEFADKPRLPKPFSVDELQALLKRRSGDGGKP
jgi:CheY-like chemotaxis protein